MAERERVNQLVLHDNYSGSVVSVDEPVDSPDASWVTVTDPTLDAEARYAFEEPSRYFLADKARQAFRLWLRRTNNGAGNPTVDIQLDYNGTVAATLLTGHEISSTSGELLEVYWDNYDLGRVETDEIRIRILGKTDGTDNVEIGAVEWQAKTYDEVFIPNGYTDQNNNLTGSHLDVDDNPSSNDGNWITADDATDITDAVFFFSNTDHGRAFVDMPSGNTAVGRFRIRKTQNIGGNTPEVAVWITNGATKENLLDFNLAINGVGSGVHYVRYFDPANTFPVNDRDGDDMRMEFDVTDGGLNGDTVEYGGIRIEAAMEAPVSSDTGTGTDTESIFKSFELKDDTDSGTGTETELREKDITETDTGASTETVAARAYQLAESGVSAEAELLEKSITETDSGTGADALSSRVLQESESGAGAEASLLEKAITEADTGTSVEAEVVNQTKVSSDSGTGSEAEDVQEIDPGRRRVIDDFTSVGIESGTWQDVDELPTNPDGNWLVFDETSGSAGFVGLEFSNNPNGLLWAPQAVQTIRVYCRRKTGVGDPPKLNARLYRTYNAQASDYVTADVEITSTTGQLVELKFRADELDLNAGFDPELNENHARIYSIHNADNTDTLEIGAVDWISRIQADVFESPDGYSDLNANLSGNVTRVDEDPRGNPDANWLLADDDAVETDAYFDFPTPARKLWIPSNDAPHNVHIFDVRVRRTDALAANDDTPNLTISTRENFLVRETSNTFQVNNTGTGELETFEWSADVFDVNPPTNLQAFVNVSSVGTFGNTVEYGAVGARYTYDGLESSDSGTGVDTESLVKTITETESGAGAEAELLDQAYVGTDTATGVDTFVSKEMRLAETATAVEAEVVSKQFTESDSATGVDVFSNKTMRVAESGAVVEVETPEKELTETESGAAVETENKQEYRTDSDTGTSIETENQTESDNGRRVPNATLGSNNKVSGDHSDLDELPDAASSDWVVFDETQFSGSIVLGLTDNENGDLWAPRAIQTIRVYARRKTGSDSAPKLSVNLTHPNTNVSLDIPTEVEITSTTGQLVEFKFTLAGSDLSGQSNVPLTLNENGIRVTSKSNTERTDAVDIGAVDWLSRVQNDIREVPVSYTDENNNLTGSVGNVQEDPENPDALWISADSDGTETDAIWDNGQALRRIFRHPDPAYSNLDWHKTQAYVRRTDNGLAADAAPDLRLDIYEGNTLRSQSSTFSITSDTGQLVEFEWSASSWGDTLDSQIELHTEVSNVGLNGNTVDYGAINHRLTYDGVEATDSATGVDNEALSIQISDSDTGVGVDIVNTLAASVSDADTGATADDATITAAALFAADTGTSVEDNERISLETQSDAVVGADAATRSAQVTDTDTNTGVTETFSKDNIDPDFGFGSEAEALSIQITSSDSGTSTETEAQPVVQRTDSDTGVGTEAQLRETEDNFSDADSGRGVESETLVVNFVEIETATFVEEVTDFLRQVADSGTGLEAGQLRTDDEGVRNPLTVFGIPVTVPTVVLEAPSDTVVVTASTTTVTVDQTSGTSVKVK